MQGINEVIMRNFVNSLVRPQIEEKIRPKCRQYLSRSG